MASNTREPTLVDHHQTSLNRQPRRFVGEGLRAKRKEGERFSIAPIMTIFWSQNRNQSTNTQTPGEQYLTFRIFCPGLELGSLRATILWVTLLQMSSTVVESAATILSKMVTWMTLPCQIQMVMSCLAMPGLALQGHGHALHRPATPQC